MNQETPKRRKKGYNTWTNHPLIPKRTTSGRSYRIAVYVAGLHILVWDLVFSLKTANRAESVCSNSDAPRGWTTAETLKFHWRNPENLLFGQWKCFHWLWGDTGKPLGLQDSEGHSPRRERGADTPEKHSLHSALRSWTSLAPGNFCRALRVCESLFLKNTRFPGKPPICPAGDSAHRLQIHRVRSRGELVKAR